MISRQEIHEWAEEVDSAEPDRLRGMCRSLLDNTHRLYDLYDELIWFRRSKEYEQVMQQLDRLAEIQKTLGSPGKGGG